MSAAKRIPDPMSSSESETLCIGIDLGTTCSLLGAWLETNDTIGRVKILENEEGYLTTPSCVVFSDDDVLVGDNARVQSALFPLGTVIDFKRLMGRRYADHDLQELVQLHQWPFDVVEGPFGKAMIQVTVRGQQKIYSPEEISAILLRKMKQIAEVAIGQTVGAVVITVPAHFNHAQRESTKAAAKMAGLRLLRLMDEPTAACIAYGMATGINRVTLEKEKTVLVLDIGGGTTGVTICTVGGGFNEYDVLSTAGDTLLGGEDFDSRLLQHCSALFERSIGYSHDLRSNPSAMRRLRTSCERAKRALSSGDVATVVIESLLAGMNFNTAITREQFEDMCIDLFKRCIDLVLRALMDANLQPSQINEVVLMGGSSRIPRIRTMVSDMFVPAGTTISTAVNPDEAEAYGATVYAAMLAAKVSPDLTDLLVLNVTPYSLGLEIIGGMTHVMISRNTKVPVRHTEVFTTCLNGQTSALFQILEGEAACSYDCRILARTRLSLLPAEARTVRIEVLFDINANGELLFRAKDITPKLPSAISPEAQSKPGEKMVVEEIEVTEVPCATTPTEEEFVETETVQMETKTGKTIGDQYVELVVSQKGSATLLELRGDDIEPYTGHVFIQNK